MARLCSQTPGRSRRRIRRRSGRVVVDHVEAAEALDGERDGRLEVGEHADVGVTEAGRPPAARTDAATARRLVVHVGQHDGRALGGEAAHRRGADARRRPGDDRDLAAQPCHRESRRCNRRPFGQSTWRRPATIRRTMATPRLRPLLRDSRRRSRGTHAQRVRRLPRRHRPGGARRGGGLLALLDRRASLPDEFSHCSAPEVLYGAVAAKTKPHQDRPRRAAAAVPLQPSRSASPRWPPRSTSSATAGSSSAPAARRRATSSRASASTRRRRATMWEEALDVVVGAWTQRRLRVGGPLLQGAAAARAPEAAPEAAPAAVGGDHAARRATSSPAGRASGCSPSPSACRPRSWPAASSSTATGSTRGEAGRASSSTTAPPPSPWCTAPRPTTRRGATPAESVLWYLRHSIELIGTLAAWQEGQRELGTLRLRADAARPRHVAPHLRRARRDGRRHRRRSRRAASSACGATARPAATSSSA